MRVENLETWAGPGQSGALAAGQREIRAELGKIRQTQDRHTRMLADLTADISELKTTVTGLETRMSGLETDMGEVKDTLREILRRLPGPQA